MERLVAGCEAYVAFGLRRPARYGVLFSEPCRRLGRLAGILQAGLSAGMVLACARARGREPSPFWSTPWPPCARRVGQLARAVGGQHGNLGRVPRDRQPKVGGSRFSVAKPEGFVRRFVLRLARIRPPAPTSFDARQCCGFAYGTGFGDHGGADELAHCRRPQQVCATPLR